MDRLWILGAPDPEMEMIERTLRERGERVAYTLDERGERVHPGAAYRARLAEPVHAGTIYEVECMIADRSTLDTEHCVTIDHHRPGDPGYGRPPSEFLTASSIGQVIAELARLGRLPAHWETGAFFEEEIGAFVFEGDAGAGAQDWWVVTRICNDDSEDGGAGDYDFSEVAKIPRDLVLCAAADHCLGAAYRGECPGVDPDDLMRWRAESRARFQGRDVSEVLSDIKRAQEALRAAPELVLSEHQCEWHASGRGGDCNNASGTDWADDPCSAVVVRDMRQPVDEQPVRELPEAATRLGIGYISGPLVGPDGRHKITCSGTAEQVRAFLEHWAPAQGLVDLYGDPARGFAGAYLPVEEG